MNHSGFECSVLPAFHFMQPVMQPGMHRGDASDFDRSSLCHRFCAVAIGAIIAFVFYLELLSASAKLCSASDETMMA